MNSPESREFIELRSGLYAAAAAQVPPPVVIEPEKLPRICVWCGKPTKERACDECAEEAV